MQTFIFLIFRTLHQKTLELESKLEDSKGTGTPRLAGSREELELKLSGAYGNLMLRVTSSEK